MELTTSLLMVLVKTRKNKIATRLRPNKQMLTLTFKKLSNPYRIVQNTKNTITSLQQLRTKYLARSWAPHWLCFTKANPIVIFGLISYFTIDAVVLSWILAVAFFSRNWNTTDMRNTARRCRLSRA